MQLGIETIPSPQNSILSKTSIFSRIFDVSICVLLRSVYSGCVLHSLFLQVLASILRVRKHQSGKPKMTSPVNEFLSFFVGCPGAALFKWIDLS